MEERRKVKDLVTWYKYINFIISHPLIVYKSTRSSHEQKVHMHSVLPNCFRFCFLIVLYQHGILFLILLFLLRFLFREKYLSLYYNLDY